MAGILQWMINWLGLTDAQLGMLGFLITIGSIGVAVVTFLWQVRKIRREQRKVQEALKNRQHYGEIVFQKHTHVRRGERTIELRIKTLRTADVHEIFKMPGLAEAIVKAAEAHNAPHPFLVGLGALLPEAMRYVVNNFGPLLKGADGFAATLLVEKGSNVRRRILRAVAYEMVQLEELDDPDNVFVPQPGREHQVDRIDASRHVATAVIDNGDLKSPYVGKLNGVPVTDFVEPV